MNTKNSQALFSRAKEVMPGGVNSPVRAFKAVGGSPIFIERAQGSRIYDVDGNEFIDYVCSYGPLILGHAHPEVVQAIEEAARKGTSYGAPHEKEVELAEMICEAFPGMEKVRLVNSGTEATMSAIRLARAYTKREKIVKFDGCYHGHGDSFLVKAGSGLITDGVPLCPGIPSSLLDQTISVKYNDMDAVKEVFDRYGEEIAAVIIEPIAANAGLILPDIEFLHGLREITREHGSMLIFDEVITGFRVCYGGVQNLLGITPDLTCLGKIIGGGLPIGAYGGKKRIMDMVAPEGQVYQAGTLSGNPLAAAAGLATLKILKEGDWYEGLDVKAYILQSRLKTIIEEVDIPITLNRYGSMFSLFFAEDEVTDYESALKADTELYKRFFHGLLARGIYLPPSQFEVCFISCAHSIEDIEATAKAAREVLMLMDQGE